MTDDVLSIRRIAITTGADVRPVPLADVAGRMKAVPLEGDTLATARELGICLGA